MSSCRGGNSVDNTLPTLAFIHLKCQDFISQRPKAFLSWTSWSNVVPVNIPLAPHWIQFRKRDSQSCDTLNNDSKRAHCPLLCRIDFNWLMAIEYSWLMAIDWSCSCWMWPIRELPCICRDRALQSVREYWNTAHSSTSQHKHIRGR